MLLWTGLSLGAICHILNTIENIFSRNEMKTIYLHIGLRKTGTTTIQKSLLHNQDLLLEHGILVPKIGRGYPEIAAQHNLAWELMGYGVYDPNLGNWEDLIDLLENRHEEKIILSSEVFSSLSIENISKVKQYLNHYTVKIIVYLRRQDQLFQSMWAQELKTGDSDHVDDNFLEWVDNNQEFFIQHGLQFDNFLSKWRSIFGKENILARVLEKRQLYGALFHDFLYTTGIDNPEQYEIAKDQNISPGIKTLVLIAELRKRLEKKLPGEARIKFYSYLNIFGIREGWNDQKFNLIDAQIHKNIMQRYRKMNRQIAQEYLGRERLFLETFKEKDLTHFSVNEFEVEEILDAFGFVLEKISQNKYQGNENGITQNYLDVKEQLDLIYSSRGWRILENLRAIRARIMDLFRKEPKNNS